MIDRKRIKFFFLLPYSILELNETFPEEPKCISLHPNGLSLLVCFNDKVCLMNMLVDGFRTVKEFNILNCSVVGVH